MKFIFTKIGPKQATKVVDIAVSQGCFNDIGFANFLEFMVAEARPHVPDAKTLEAVAIDGMPDMLASQFVLVRNGSFSCGHVTLQA